MNIIVKDELKYHPNTNGMIFESWCVSRIMFPCRMID